MTEEQPPEPVSTEQAAPWQTAWKIAVGFLAVFAVVALLAKMFSDPIESAGMLVVERYGLFGLAISVLIVDMIPTPLSYVPFMLLALAGGLSFWAVFFTSSMASYLAGFTGYGIGRAVGMPPRLEAWLQAKHPKIREILDRQGVWGLAAIGILPLPLALGSWSAGALKLSLPRVAIALLVRFPKTLFYLWMIKGGLKLGSG